jgi:hypothetical protein
LVRTGIRDRGYVTNCARKREGADSGWLSLWTKGYFPALSRLRTQTKLVHKMNHTFSVEHAVKYGIEEAILIGNFQFWLAKNRADKRNQYDGRTWTYNSAIAFSELIPYFSTDKVDRTIKSLVKQGIILVGNYNEKPSDRTRWFAFVNEDLFLGVVKKKEPKKSVEPLPEPFRESAEWQGNPSALSRNGNRESAEAFRESAECLYTTDITTDITTDKNLQTASADAPEECAGEPAASELAAGPTDSAPADHKAVLDHQGATPAFEAAWAMYPARPGNAKHHALSAWKARVAEGVSEKALLDGVRDYAAHCKREKIAMRFVMAAGRFFGSEAHYAANWSAETPEQLPFFDDGDYSNTVMPL